MLNDNLRAVRKRADITILALAQACGVSPTTLFRWERGERTPTDAQVAAWAKACGVTVEDLHSPEPDRSGWPVLVKKGAGWEEANLGVEIVPGVGFCATYNLWTCEPMGSYPTLRAAADAIRARLPEDVEAKVETPKQGPPGLSKPCPLCKGKGVGTAVDSVGPEGVTNPRPETCFVCEGNGYLLLAELGGDEVAPKPPNPPYTRPFVGARWGDLTPEARAMCGVGTRLGAIKDNPFFSVELEKVRPNKHGYVWATVGHLSDPADSDDGVKQDRTITHLVLTPAATVAEQPAPTPATGDLAAMEQRALAAEADRDAWKAKAAEADRDTAMYVEQVRSTEAERNGWRNRAIAAEKMLDATRAIPPDPDFRRLVSHAIVDAVRDANERGWKLPASFMDVLDAVVGVERG